MTASSVRKRSSDDGDDQDGKRLKSSSGGSEVALRGGAGDSSKAPNVNKRGVARPPTDEEWAELVATGVILGIDDLNSPTPDSETSSLLDIEIGDPLVGDDDEGSTYLGEQVDPIPIKLSANPSTRATPKKTSKYPTDTTPKQARFDDPADFDPLTPFSSGMESSFLAYGDYMGFTDMSEYIEYASEAPNPVTYVEWKVIQDRFDDPDMPVPYLGGSDSEASPVSEEGAGDDGNGGHHPPSPSPPSEFTEDHEILQRWMRLETTIEQYVEECITEAMPEEIDLIHNSPYTVFRYLAGDDISYEMCQSPRYSPYLFQITIWNFLLRNLFSRGSTAWGADFKSNADRPTMGQGSGLGLATDQVTNEVLFSQNQNRTYQNRLKFFIFRKEACDFIYECLVDDAGYADQVNEMCQDLMYLFTGYFKPDYARGTAESWTELLRLTTDVVTKAWDLAILMRKSDGVWDAFVMMPEKSVLKDCVQLHQRKDLALPRGQSSILPDSKITMTVVPGLVKHEVVPDDSRGPDGSRVRTMRRICMKAFVDLQTEDI